MYEAKILADSLSPEGHRLTTFQVQYPRFVHSEFMTHRMFSRNAASSRAIPIQKTIEAVLNDPVIPVYWGKNQPGMQAEVELEGVEKVKAEVAWLKARDLAVESALAMTDLHVHKQLVNRVLEPWTWITAIVTATEWENFWQLRCHADAQPELRKIADWMRRLHVEHEPQRCVDLKSYDVPWHLPLVSDVDMDSVLSDRDLCRISVGRCARVSYLTHDGKRDIKADMDLHDRLAASRHWSPFEHVATPQAFPHWSGNFFGWDQYRKQFPEESGTRKKGPRNE